MSLSKLRLSIQSDLTGSAPTQLQNGATIVLMELEKQLRSQQPGDQMEAIISLPQLFLSYPLPMLINAVFLRVSDVFRLGNNFQRFQIVKVVEQSKKHLDKISSVDEIVRKIFSVSHSTDVMARALTVRLLGSMAAITGEKKNVHHAIIKALSSKETVELYAATFAARQICVYSSSFAVDMCGKVRELLSCADTSRALRMRLIPILQYMHHSAQLSAMAMKQCVTLFQEQRHDIGEVVLVIKTSTILAAAMPDLVCPQINLLFTHMDPFVEFSRHTIHRLCCRALVFLVRKSPHMWTSRNTQQLCRYIREEQDPGIISSVLTLIQSLVETVAVTKLGITSSGCEIAEVCKDMVGESEEVSAQALSVLASIHTYKLQCEVTQETVPRTLCTTAVASAQRVIMQVNREDGNHRTIQLLDKYLRVLLKYCVFDEQVKSQSANMVTSFILASSTKNLRATRLLCSFLVKISSQTNGVVSSRWRGLITRVKATQDHHTLTSLCSILFLNLKANLFSHVQEDLFSHLDQTCPPWVLFCVARQACRYTQFGFAHQLFLHLTEQAVTEKNRCWLRALAYVCEAEHSISLVQSTTVSDAVRDRLGRAVEAYSLASTELAAAVTPQFSHSFQIQFVQLKQSLAQLLLTVLSCPPFSSSSSNMDVLLALTSLKADIHSLLKLCNLCMQKYFNIDPLSLDIMSCLDRMICLLLNLVEQLMSDGVVPPSPAVLRDLGTSGMANPRANQSRQVELSKLLSDISELEDKASCEQAIKDKDLHSLALQLALIAVPIPRFFFQSLQHTSIKLFISPQAQSKSTGTSHPSDAISVRVDTGLHLHVEGVVERELGHGTQAVEFRRVQSVIIRVNSCIQNRSSLPASLSQAWNKQPQGSHSMEKTVDVCNDYFSHQFILSFPMPGLHAVAISMRVIDDTGFIWHTGPQHHLTVKSYFHYSQQHQQTQQ